jgi:hypothetical protein
MGHIHLGRLPRTQPWNAVVDLLRLGASAADIASATSRAAETSLSSAAFDLGLRHSFWLLTNFRWRPAPTISASVSGSLAWMLEAHPRC